jgi:uncharacterized protein YgiM (DUF1202 family)
VKYYILAFVVFSLACGIAAPAVIKESHVDSNKPVAVNTGDSTAKSVSRMLVVNSGGLNVRECAGTQCKAIGLLQDGDIVTLTGKTDVIYVYTWYEISAPVQGWANGRYLIVYNSPVDPNVEKE